MKLKNLRESAFFLNIEHTEIRSDIYPKEMTGEYCGTSMSSDNCSEKFLRLASRALTKQTLDHSFLF